MILSTGLAGSRMLGPEDTKCSSENLDSFQLGCSKKSLFAWPKLAVSEIALHKANLVFCIVVDICISFLWQISLWCNDRYSDAFECELTFQECSTMFSSHALKHQYMPLGFVNSVLYCVLPLSVFRRTHQNKCHYTVHLPMNINKYAP